MSTIPVRGARTGSSEAAGELYGRAPSSVITDPGLSPSAVRIYVAITLVMARDQNPTICLDRMADLATLAGVEIRQARRAVKQLEERGHVARERVREIPGSPQGIRPLARFRGPSTRSEMTDCNRSGTTVHPVTKGAAPGQKRPVNRSSPTIPLKREGEKENPEERPAVGDKPDGTGSPPPVAAEDSPEDLAALEEMAAKPGPVGAWARKYLDTRAHEKAPGPSAKTAPGARQGLRPS